VLRDAFGHSDSQLSVHLPHERILLAADMLSDIEIPLMGGPVAPYLETLRALAEQGGTIQVARAGSSWPKVEKRIQEIRKVLQKRFGLSADPIPFLSGVGYKACFKINCGPSFNT